VLQPGAEFWIAGDAMFGIGPMEMLIVGVIALMLFRKRLPEVSLAHRRRMYAQDARWDEIADISLKAAVLVLVACLWYFVLNSR
jgi:Na+/H+ antiporter NhaD/arsenite permease-like protein